MCGRRSSWPNHGISLFPLSLLSTFYIILAFLFYNMVLELLWFWLLRFGGFLVSSCCLPFSTILVSVVGSSPSKISVVGSSPSTISFWLLVHRLQQSRLGSQSTRISLNHLALYISCWTYIIYKLQLEGGSVGDIMCGPWGPKLV